MRQNLPITHNEYTFPDGDTLVSTTDLKGRLTYCNPSFVRVSGYSRDELIGQPHNLIRHPDMPAEAFRDMWETIRSGQPWSALVKNRRKNGDHYWVRANVTPVLERGQPVGYMSVRSKPHRNEVAAAEALYAGMRREAQRGSLVTLLREGGVVRRGWRGALQRASQPGLGGQIVLWSLALPALAASGTADWLGASPAQIAACAAAGAALGGLQAWALRRAVLAPLRGLVDTANRLAAGDLAQRGGSPRPGDLGRLERALAQLNVNLQAVVGDVRREVDGIQVATREIAAGNEDLSSRTEAQAGNLQQTATSLQQIAGNVHTSADAARSAAHSAEQTQEMAARSQQSVGEIVEHMAEIGRASGRIVEIIGVINGISFQTNLLALNAAVEAARAGEAGKGFAVVASEVRALAGRTQQAAGEIKVLVEDALTKIEQGSERVRANGSLMQQTLSAVQEVNALVHSISRASQEQSQGLTEVNQAVGSLDDITQQNAAMVEQLSAAAGSLRNQAEVVADAVRIFRIQELAGA